MRTDKHTEIDLVPNNRTYIPLLRITELNHGWRNGATPKVDRYVIILPEIHISRALVVLERQLIDIENKTGRCIIVPGHPDCLGITVHGRDIERAIINGGEAEVSLSETGKIFNWLTGRTYGDIREEDAWLISYERRTLTNWNRNDIFVKYILGRWGRKYGNGGIGMRHSARREGLL